MPAYPIICVEGPDGGGKTTLAQTLQAKLGAHYLHSTYRFKGKMAAYHWAQLRTAIRLAQSKPVILDRWWPSEIVYSNVYRSGPEQGYHYKDLHNVAKLYGMSYVFACPTRWEHYWEWYQNHYEKDKEMYPLSEPHVNMAWMNYRDIMLRDYYIFERDILHYYSVVLDAYRCDFFADHIINRFKIWIGQQGPERKQAIRDLSANWREIGRCPSPLPTTETYRKPIQGSFL
jgi:adenylate kinase family enzyme